MKTKMFRQKRNENVKQKSFVDHFMSHHIYIISSIKYISTILIIQCGLTRFGARLNFNHRVCEEPLRRGSIVN